MESKQQLDKLIDKIQQDLDDAKRKRDELEVTYSIGDRFRHNGDKHILARGEKRDDITMINLRNGEAWSHERPAKDMVRITQPELDTVLSTGKGTFIRYWDARKKERC
jgi:hypothetical protein